MLKFIQVFEVILIPIMAILSLLIALADFLGLLSALPWISSRIPTITLLLVSLALSSLSIMQGRFAVSQRELHQEVLLLLSNKELDSIHKSLERLNPVLRKIFEEDVLDLFGSLTLAVHESKIQLNDLQRFRYYYARTLQKFPRATFLATSIPSATFFWKNPGTEAAISEFIHKGGKMMRVFFVSGPEELATPEVQEILARQCEIGVEVYTTNSTSIPNNLKVLFMVDNRAQIGWETFLDEGRRVRSVMATANRKETEKFCSIFNQLLQADGTRRYLPDKPP